MRLLSDIFVYGLVVLAFVACFIGFWAAFVHNFEKEPIRWFYEGNYGMLQMKVPLKHRLTLVRRNRFRELLGTLFPRPETGDVQFDDNFIIARSSRWEHSLLCNNKFLRARLLEELHETPQLYRLTVKDGKLTLLLDRQGLLPVPDLKQMVQRIADLLIRELS